MYVAESGSGSDGVGCGAITSPCATLAYAVENIVPSIISINAEEPVLIQVGPGTYTSSCNVKASRPLAIMGSGKTSTVFDCGNQASLLITNSSLWMSSLTIQNGNSAREGGGLTVGVTDAGPGIQPRLTVTLYDLAVINCTAAGNGGGIAIMVGPALDADVAVSLRGVDAIGNSVHGSSGGGGFYLHARGSGSLSIDILDSTFSSNRFDDLGGTRGEFATFAVVISSSTGIIIELFVFAGMPTIPSVEGSMWA